MTATVQLTVVGNRSGDHAIVKVGDKEVRVNRGETYTLIDAGRVNQEINSSVTLSHNPGEDEYIANQEVLILDSEGETFEIKKPGKAKEVE